MGYYSDYDGMYKFSKKLTPEQEEKLRGFIEETFGHWPDIVYNAGEQFYDEDISALYPANYNLKAYDFNMQLLKIVHWCRDNGYPSISGDVYRDGEESEDYEKISVKNGKVWSWDGKIVYSNKCEVFLP